MLDIANPTNKTYAGLTDAYEFFNARLFGGKLPPCLITMQRKSKAYGYFAGGRFGSRAGTDITDEIALNPTHFAGRSNEAILSTLVHEMTHLEQQHFGKPSRTGYHNKEWAQLMRAVGLIPSDTGQPGGKQTGQHVSHYIEEGGPFAVVCAELVGPKGFAVPYVEMWGEGEAEKRKKKAASKTKYTCPSCQVNAWAKPETRLICGECEEPMEGEAAVDPEESVEHVSV